MSDDRYVKLAEDDPQFHAAGGAKVANRRHFVPTPPSLDDQRRAGSVGDFLSRLWARFGPPNSVQDEGFAYHLRDREADVLFMAYAAGSGPAYGAALASGVTRESLRHFDAWIAATPPADCMISYPTDFGVMESGAEGGVPFDREAKKKEKQEKKKKARENK